MNESVRHGGQILVISMFLDNINSGLEGNRANFKEKRQKGRGKCPPVPNRVVVLEKDRGVGLAKIFQEENFGIVFCLLYQPSKEINKVFITKLTAPLGCQH